MRKKLTIWLGCLLGLVAIAGITVGPITTGSIGGVSVSNGSATNLTVYGGSGAAALSAYGNLNGVFGIFAQNLDVADTNASTDIQAFGSGATNAYQNMYNVDIGENGFGFANTNAPPGVLGNQGFLIFWGASNNVPQATPQQNFIATEETNSTLTFSIGNGGYGTNLQMTKTNSLFNGNVTINGNFTNTSILGTPTASFLLPNIGGWAATNTGKQPVFVTITYDLTPTVTLQAAIDARWTNSLGTYSNSFTSPVGTAAERVSLSGMLESNGVVQITTNRGGGATVVFTLVQSVAIPIP